VIESPILTEEEAIRWLRLDEEYDSPREAGRALRRCMHEHGLRRIQGCGKSLKFHIDELHRWVRQQYGDQHDGQG